MDNKGSKYAPQSPLAILLALALALCWGLQFSACESAPHQSASQDGSGDGDGDGDGEADPEEGGGEEADPSTGDPGEDDSEDLSVSASKITFGAIQSGKSQLKGSAGAITGDEDFSVALSIKRNGKEQIAADQSDVTRYVKSDGSFSISAQGVADGDLATLTASGAESKIRYTISATLSSAGDQVVTVEKETPAESELAARSCTTPVAGAWTSGSCTADPLPLTSAQGADPLENLVSSCNTAGSSGCTTGELGEGWASEAAAWYTCTPEVGCYRYENIKFETVSAAANDGMDGTSYHIFSVREEDGDDATLSFPDGPARVINYTFPTPLSTGAYKLSLDTSCAMTDESGAQAGGCIEPNVGNITQELFISPLTVVIRCAAGDEDPLTLIYNSIPPYPEKTRFEVEFVVPTVCQSTTLSLQVYNDIDIFETRVGNSLVTFNNPFLNDDPTQSTNLFRSYIVDNFSIAPLDLHNSAAISEMTAGLFDYFQVLRQCEGDCGKTFAKNADDTIDMFNTGNSAYLVSDPYPYLVRKDDYGSTTNYELLHSHGGNRDQEPITTQPYFFLSKRPDQVAPWIVPLESETDRADNGLVLKQLSGMNDTLRTWIAVRNPTASALSPTFRLPSSWSIYAVVQLPKLMLDFFSQAITGFKIIPDHLSKCHLVSGSGGKNEVACDTWKIPAYGSRTYVLEVPPLSRGVSATLSLLSGASGSTYDSLPISISLLSPAAGADYTRERLYSWDTVNVYTAFDDESDMDALFKDYSTHHVTDVAAYSMMVSNADGSVDTFDETAINQDLNGDGAISSFSYVAMQNQSGACVPNDSANVVIVNNTDSFVSKLHEYNLNFSLALSGSAWSWRNHSNYPNAIFWQANANTDTDNDGICEAGGSDMNLDGSPDWNAVIFEGDNVATAKAALNIGDIVSSDDPAKANIYMPLGRIVDKYETADRIVFFLDIPFPYTPGKESGETCKRSGTLYKLSYNGMVNAGIQVAKSAAARNAYTSATEADAAGAGICQTVADLEPINYPRDLGNIVWSRTKDQLDFTAKCMDGEVQVGCDLSLELSDSQQALLAKMAERIKTALEGYNPGKTADDLVVHHSNLYDETKAFGREDQNFQGFGQTELIGVTDVFERAGLRTTNASMATYNELEYRFRAEDPENRRGMSYHGTTGTTPVSAPLSAFLLEYYRDTQPPEGQPLIDSGGYGPHYLFQRYSAGLARHKVGQLDDVATPGSLLWGYPYESDIDQSCKTHEACTDPDYLSDEGYANDTANYVAARDFLDRGTSTYPYTRFGLMLPALPVSKGGNPEDSRGEESVEYTAILEGIHDSWMAKTLSGSAMEAAIEALPWGYQGIRRNNFQYSTCMLNAVLNNPENLSGDLAHALACACGDFKNDASCEE